MSIDINDRAERIAGMDLSNLTDEQIEIIRQLTLRAEDGFDQRARRSVNDDMRNLYLDQADACTELLDRLRYEARVIRSEAG